jgi:hypothetical protein
MSKSVETTGQVGNANISMIMNFSLKTLCTLLLGLTLAHTHSFAQTDGAARMAVTINDYTGTSNTKHWTVAWVTTGSGTFIKSLRKQGPSITTTHWNSHCGTWWTAKSSSTALDGYSSATAQDYAGTNSPVLLTWNCRDAANNLVADGDYKFWVQYAEDSGQGPFTTSGLLWTKGPGGVTNNYANQGANFTGMQVAWQPSTPAPVAPTITSLTPPATGTVGVPYNFTVTATGTAPITFTGSGPANRRGDQRCRRHFRHANHRRHVHRNDHRRQRHFAQCHAKLLHRHERGVNGLHGCPVAWKLPGDEREWSGERVLYRAGRDKPKRVASSMGRNRDERL